MNQIIVDRDRSRIIFSTGRSVYANNGIIGIRARDQWDDESDLPCSVSEGYDGALDPGGSIRDASGEYVPYDAPDHGLTAEERRELSLYCIDLWMKYGRLSREDIVGGLSVSWA